MLLPLLMLLFSVGSSAVQQSSEPDNFFREYVGLNDRQIQSIRSGKALVKILPSHTSDEVFIFGAVYVQSDPERYLELASNVEALRKLPSYLAIRKFSDPPRLSDLDGFTFEEEDIKELKNCKPGHCEVQLPTEAMEAFQQSVNWAAPDRADQVNHLAQQMALECLQRYIQGGNSELGTYRDKEHPTEIAEAFQSLVSWSKALPVYLPELRGYLLDYPHLKSNNIQSQFYWEKVKFGLKPTLRVVQAIVFRGTSASGEPVFAVAEKQLYASHYFQAALDLTVCVKEASRPNQTGFYLLTLKGSQQAGLTGLKGGIVRKVAVDKSRSSTERTLVALKQKLESQSD